MPFVWRENKHSLHSFVYLSVRREQLQLLHQTSSKQDTCLKNQNWTRRCETKKLYERMAISHPPFRPFSTVIFILKDSFPQKFYIWPVWETNNKIQMVNFQNGDDAKRDFKAILCLTALHLCAMPSRIFFVVFQLWQPVGNQRAAILIFVIHIYTIELVCSTRKLMISFNWSMKLMVVLDN